MSEKVIKIQEAQISEEHLDELVDRYRKRLLACASSAVNHYVTEQDDEWSVALLAFCEAVRKYDAGCGGFWPFASTVVRRRLTDHLRKVYREAAAVSVDPAVWNGGFDEDGTENGMSHELLCAAGTESEKTGWPGMDTVAEEMEAVGDELKDFGISFFDLTECSPKAEKSREKCGHALAALFAPPPLTGKMRKSGVFPASEVERRSGVSRKVLDKHRKYLIASALILDGDYPLLAEYLEPVRKEIRNR